jgi:phosphatidylserine/phosphatidylglycerophosphate/cardiolipin synthase-like enzyme
MPTPATPELLLNAEHYSRLLCELVPSARQFLWIATADLKDLFVEGGPKHRPFRPFVAQLADLVGRGVAVRLLHAKEPGPRFRADFDKHPALRDSDLFERGLCPRLHSKIIIVDGVAAYVGSANLTGAGLGAKGPHRRNFEAGILLRDRASVTRLMDEIDSLWLGRHCGPCQRRELCPDPLDLREA